MGHDVKLVTKPKRRLKKREPVCEKLDNDRVGVFGKIWSLEKNIETEEHTNGKVSKGLWCWKVVNIGSDSASSLKAI